MGRGQEGPASVIKSHRLVEGWDGVDLGGSWGFRGYGANEFGHDSFDIGINDGEGVSGVHVECGDVGSMCCRDIGALGVGPCSFLLREFDHMR